MISRNEESKCHRPSKAEVTIRCTFPDCDWSKEFASKDECIVFVVRWYDYHKHDKTGSFQLKTRFSLEEENKTWFREGEVWTFKTIDNYDSQANPITAKAPDGRVALFEKDAPLTASLKPGRKVKGVIKVIKHNCIVATPIEDTGPVGPLDTGRAERDYLPL